MSRGKGERFGKLAKNGPLPEGGDCALLPVRRGDSRRGPLLVLQRRDRVRWLSDGVRQRGICTLLPHPGKGGDTLTLLEMSVFYRRSAAALGERVARLRADAREERDPEERRALCRRMAELKPLLQESRELAVLTARYYDRSYHRHGHYTV